MKWRGDDPDETVTTMVAVDPGDIHVGVAFFESTDPDVDESWVCVDTQEMTPNEFADGLMEALIDGDFDYLVYEKFRLYEDLAAKQRGSEMETSQLIGVIKWQTRSQNAHAANHERAEREGKIITCELRGQPCEDPNKRVKPVVVAGQMADIQKPTIGIARHKKIKSTAKRQKTGAHTYSAELHGLYWIYKGRHR